jgi:hypothetical protein
MHLGRHALGAELCCTFQADNGSKEAVTPSSPPQATVHSAAGATVESHLVPARDRTRSPSLYTLRVNLDGSYSAGRYMVSFRYASGGTPRLKAATFDVVAGGDASGAVISQFHLERPHATYIVTKCDSGARKFRRGPYL